MPGEGGTESFLNYSPSIRYAHHKTFDNQQALNTERLPPNGSDTDIVTNGYFHHRNPRLLRANGSRGGVHWQHGPLPGPSTRLAVNLDLDDVARRSPKPGIAIGNGDDALIFVASPQAD